MSLTAGRVVLGRWELVRELSGTGDLWRWEARDRETGALVELAAPRLMAALRPGASERFAAAGRARSTAPAFQARLAEGLEGTLPLAVRPLGRGPWPAEARLDGPAVEAMASWLGPALLEAGEALAEGLRPEDLSLDAEGVPRLAPLSLPHGGAVHDPPRHRPPELRAGGAPSGEAALYGLGVLLFRAATGQEAVPGDTAAAWGAGQPRRARALRPDLPESTDDLLAGLLSADPAARRAALATLPSPAGPPRLPLAPAAPAATPAPRTAPRVGAPTGARLDVGLGAWSVAVRPSTLPRPALRRAAALTGAWPSALAAAGAGATWVGLAEARTRAEAEARAASLAALGVPSRVLAGEPPRAKTLAAMALLGLGLLLGVLGLFLLPALLLALAALAGGAALGAAALELRAAQRSAAEGRARLLEALRSPDPASVAERELAEARRALLEADLPDTARRDLLDRLDETEDGLGAGEGAGRARAAAQEARARAAAISQGG